MKMLMLLGIIVVVFTSCGTLTPQETQQERLRLIEAYNEARQRQNPEKNQTGSEGPPCRQMAVCRVRS